VKTGVQEVLEESKILDSGFRRNDGEKAQTDFFTASGGSRGISGVPDIFGTLFSDG